MSERESRQLRLGAFLWEPGLHVSAWRHPEAPALASMNLDHYVHAARCAERGGFDFVFLADNLSVRNCQNDPDVFRRTGYPVHFEPLTLISALSMATERIGLISTVSTSYAEPYTVARLFASLDHISGGRVGWNVVTSASHVEAHNFGREQHFSHEERYARASEFVDVVTGLWDSWDDDAFVGDKTAGISFDIDRVHVLDHRGEHFRVRGPLNVARPIQGHPVIVQAGSSETGQTLAARTAEVVFTGAYTLEAAQAFYTSLKSKVAAAGRRAEDVAVMPGLIPIVGRTAAEAEARYALLQELIDPVIGVALLSRLVGEFDLSAYPVDGPLPELPPSNSSRSALERLLVRARSENLTIRGLYQSINSMGGHRQIHGTPETIADEMESWFHAGGADGFNILPSWLPGGLEDFVDLVVPELRRRGLLKRAYAGRTLREHLGLPRPPNRFAGAAR